MSNTQFAFLQRARVPARDALQGSIASLGYDLQLNPQLNLLVDAGFSPCVLEGVSRVGFELFAEPAVDVTQDDPEFESLAGNNDFCISMSWGGSFRDLACVMIVSAALAKDFGAVVTYEGEPPSSAEELIEQIEGILVDARKERRRT